MSVWKKSTGKIVGFYDIFEYRNQEEALKDLKEVFEKLELMEPLEFNKEGYLVHSKDGRLRKKDVDETISFSGYGERGILTIEVLGQSTAGYRWIDGFYPRHDNILISKLLKEKLSKK